MGNKFTKHRILVDEKYTQPQGLYEHIGLDTRKLKRLIVNGQLAPCFPGVEDPSIELDECPICFLSYPSLNRSKCCTKAICTECFLQIKSLHPARSARSAQCPFCKITNYGVEYRGVKSLEEKGMEQAEEQKIIEAKIRIRQKEIHEEEERILGREINLQNGHGEDVEAKPAGDYQGSLALTDLVPISQLQDFLSERDTRAGLQREAVVPRHATESPVCHLNSDRENFDFDLEDVMVMEAIWLSIQDHEGSGHTNGRSSNIFIDGNTSSTPETISRGVTGSLAGAIAALAESQVNRCESNPDVIHGQIDSVIAAQRSAEISKLCINSQMNPVIASEANAEPPPIRVPRSTAMNLRKESHVQSTVNSENKHEEEEHEEEEHEQAKLETGQLLNNCGGLMVGRDNTKGSTSGWSRTLLPLLQRYSKVSSSSGSHGCEVTPLEETSDQPSSSASLSSMVADNFDEQIMLALGLSLADAQKRN